MAPSKKKGGKKKKRTQRSQLVKILISTAPNSGQEKKPLPGARGVGTGVGAGVSPGLTPNAPAAGGLLNPWLQNTGRNADMDAKSFAQVLSTATLLGLQGRSFPSNYPVSDDYAPPPLTSNPSTLAPDQTQRSRVRFGVPQPPIPTPASRPPIAPGLPRTPPNTKKGDRRSSFLVQSPDPRRNLEFEGAVSEPPQSRGGLISSVVGFFSGGGGGSQTPYRTPDARGQLLTEEVDIEQGQG